MATVDVIGPAGSFRPLARHVGNAVLDPDTGVLRVMNEAGGLVAAYAAGQWGAVRTHAPVSDA